MTYHKAHEGISRVVKIRYAYEHILKVDLSDSMHNALCERYTEIVEQKVVDCESVEGALEFLAQAAGQLDLFIVSGTPEEELKRITDRRGISRYFSAIYGSPRKKEDIVSEVLTTKGFTAADCLFIGDAMTDHDAAKACRMPFLGRVVAGEKSPFPKATKTVSDLTGLGDIAGIFQHGRQE